MSDFESAIAEAQAAAEQAAAQAEQYDAAGYTVEQVQELYPEPTYEQPAEPTYVPEAQGDHGGQPYYSEQAPAPMPFDYMVQYGEKKALETIAEKVVVAATELSSAVVGLVVGCIFELESDQASSPHVVNTTSGYQATCPGYHDAYGATWAAPYRETRSEAEWDLDNHTGVVHYFSDGTPMGTGGGYQ